MNPLDRLVRQSLLQYPLLFQSRWDVLVHLYLVIGNGYEWYDGELAPVTDGRVLDESQARANFFRDLDGLEDSYMTRPEDVLRRARRQFQLDHLDELVREDRRDYRIGGLTASDLIQVNPGFSHAFNVPDLAEESFRLGAVEVLTVVRQSLEYMGMKFGERAIDLAAQTQQQLDRLRRLGAEL